MATLITVIQSTPSLIKTKKKNPHHKKRVCFLPLSFRLKKPAGISTFSSIHLEGCRASSGLIPPPLWIRVLFDFV
jgi:hypothetical protein